MTDEEQRTPQAHGTPLAQWSYTGKCLRCGAPISACGMAEVGAHFDYRIICQQCGAEHTLEVSVE